MNLKKQDHQKQKDIQFTVDNPNIKHTFHSICSSVGMDDIYL